MPVRYASLLIVLMLVISGGCVTTPRLIAPQQQRPLDRALVETPAGTSLFVVVDHLTAPTAMCIDNTPGENQGTVLIAEGGVGGNDVRIFALKPGATALTTIYPRGNRIPFLNQGFVMNGPIGGMVCVAGKIIVTHRDRGGMGVVTALGYDGGHSTIVADLPAQGDYSVTDIAINPVNGRLYFGVGAATNSGVVGLDNWANGWVDEHPAFHDLSFVQLKLLGFRFDTKNPRAGLWGGADIAVTAPYQAFNSSNQTRVRGVLNGKPTSAIYSVSPGGGDLRVEAHGVRLPRGLAFTEYGNLYFTNDGMEMRGTRPVKDDPDSLLRLSPGSQNAVPWYGFPDYTTDLNPVNFEKYQPPMELVSKFGYPEVSALIDHQASNLASPDLYRSTLLFGTFASQSGAAKLDFVPGGGLLKQNRGDVIVALSGDRAPFATSGRKLVGPIGYKVVRVDVDPSKRQVFEFIRNTSAMPASRMGEGVVALERPCDVKFASDGSMYLLDMGRVTNTNGKERVGSGTGRLFKLVASDALQSSDPATQPAR
jgi:glucose/arabinose dehydrogenase